MDSLLFFLALLVLAALLEPISERCRLPHSITIVVLGYAGAEILTRVFNIDTGIRWDNISVIVIYGLLPVLIFRSALDMDVRALRADWVPILLLALPLLILSAVLTAVGVYYGINHPGFPWMAALLTGSLLCATEPAAVLSLLKKFAVPRRLPLLLEGESLFNDATTIMLVGLVTTMAVTGMQQSSGVSILLAFTKIFLGGLVLGGITGMLTLFLLRITSRGRAGALVSLLCAYATFIIAEVHLGVSGAIGVLVAGLIIGAGRDHGATNRAAGDCLDSFWDFAFYIVWTLVFALAGVTINLSMFTDQWLAILIGIAAVLVARVLIIFGVFPLMNLLPGITPVPLSHQVALTWGGVRGTVTLALALSLPVSLSYWYTIQSIAYGVVLFTLVIQTITMPLLLRRLRL